MTAHFCIYNYESTKAAASPGSARHRPERIIDSLQEAWELNDPEAILWVTGQVKGRVRLDPSTENALKRGLARLVRSTDAWIMTAGMDSGVMEFIGEAIGGFGETPCIGVCSLQKVTNHKKLKLSHVQSVNNSILVNGCTYKDVGSKRTADGDRVLDTVALQRHHTHFLLVDRPGLLVVDPDTGQKQAQWGGE